MQTILVKEWFENKKINIEELLKRKGESVKRITSDKEVFEFMSEAKKLNEQENPIEKKPNEANKA